MKEELQVRNGSKITDSSFWSNEGQNTSFYTMKTFQRINYSTSLMLLCRWSNNYTRTAIFKAEILGESEFKECVISFFVNA